MNQKLTLALITALTSAPAFADDGQFPPPPHVAPITGGGAVVNGNPVNCKGAVTKSLGDFRSELRKEYAAKVAQAIPHLGLQSPVNGVSCIRNPEAFNSAYNAGDDTFTLTCLAHSRVPMNGRMEDVFSHILQLRFKADPACLSMPDINTALEGTKCLIPSFSQSFLQAEEQRMRNCVTGLELDASSGLSPPPFIGTPVAFPIDGAWYNNLLQRKPSVGNIIDEDRRIKGSASTPIPGHVNGPSGTNGGEADDCAANPFNCQAVPAK